MIIFCPYRDWRWKRLLEIIGTEDPNFGVSYGYRRILRPEAVGALPPVVKLHIGYLPWNRGADPNLWAALDGTPRGVAIHWVDGGVDTGDIIFRREVAAAETLGKSYWALHEALLETFAVVWPTIVAGTAPRTVQTSLGEKGSFHRVGDRSKEFPQDTLMEKLEKCLLPVPPLLDPKDFC